jgi:hypothetical protein
VAVPNTEPRNKRELNRNLFHLETGTDFCLRSYSKHRGCGGHSPQAAYLIHTMLFATF